MQHILIVKMSSLGDIIHAFPVLQYLKHREPQFEIDWVVEQPFAELVQAHPLVHHVHHVQTKQWRSHLLKRITWQEINQFRQELRKKDYDLILDLQGNMKSGFVTALASGGVKVGFDYASVPEWPNLLATNQRYRPPSGQNIREDYLFLAQRAMEDHTPYEAATGIQLSLPEQEKTRLQPIVDHLQQKRELKILVCPGSNWTNKQLPKEALQSFLRAILKQWSAYFLLVWGNPTEKAVAEELAAALSQQSLVVDRLSLPALQNLMAQVDLVLAMDSLPLHLAGTTSTPTYSIFGASSAQKYQPIGKHHQAFQGSCPYGKTFEKRCAILRTCKTGACIKELQGQQLFEHFYKWWSSVQSG
jgi:heptosyltransferase-1